jgi:hypothetical protein
MYIHAAFQGMKMIVKTGIKLNVNDRTQAAAAFARWGLIEYWNHLWLKNQIEVVESVE